MVTPPFRAGASDTSYPVWKTAPPDGMFSCRRPMAVTSAQFQGAPFQASAVLQTAWLGMPLPALKGGVTVKFAFQASYAFQASAVLLSQDT